MSAENPDIDERTNAFREEIRAFLARHLPPEMRHASSAIETMDKSITAAWQRICFEHGYAAPSWPVAFGGAGWEPWQTRIWFKETARAGAPLPSGFGLVMVGPVICAFGTPDQQEQHLPPILRGERFWCQGYSEPMAGSDLASLRTSARRDGQDYVVNGQKIWTTQAHWADWMFCLVRTATTDRSQAGITFLLIDMKTPGIEVRPIRSIDGLHHLNEVFFTDVRVPISNRIGEENAGWTYAKFLLGNERAGIAGVGKIHAKLTRLEMTARDRGGAAAVRLRALQTRAAALDALEERALGAGVGASSQRLAAPLKLLGTELMQDVDQLAVDMSGPGALIEPCSARDATAYGVQGERAMTSLLFGRSHTIYGGTSEIQRNILARLYLREAVS